jgi:thiol-disulfide isomerase/thioredoxin
MRWTLALFLLMPTAAADVTGLYFGASYCQPCRSLQPALARLPRVAYVDAGNPNNAETCRRYEVASIPQIIFIEDGVEIDRIQGASPDWQRRCEDRLSGRNNWRPIRAAVRVRTPGGIGSGVILSSVPGRTVIATAAHIVRDEPSVTVDLFRDFGVKTFPATVAAVNDTTDLALLTVASNTLPLPSAVGASQVPEIGDTCFGIGCSGGRGVSVMACRVVSLDGGDVFASGAPAQGRSGGGLFNRRFELIGICSAANERRQDGWYIGADKLKALLSEWKPTQYRSGFGVGLGIGIGCVSGPCRNPNCRRCYPPRIPAQPPQQVAGPRGATGPQGPPGRPGRDAPAVDLSELTKRVEALEKQKRRVMLVDGATGTVIDDESYAADEPILLDVQALKVK